MLNNTRKFHNRSCLQRLSPVIPREKWPEEWIRISFRQYPRFFYKTLQVTKLRPVELSDALARRLSHRRFRSRSISFEELSNLLHYSGGIRWEFHGKQANIEMQSRRFYPSPGARYSAEIYPVVLRQRELPKGVYHYNVRRNLVELLFPGAKKDSIAKLFVDPWVRTAPLILVLTSVFSRTQVKYGERGYRFALLEIGHLAQNILLVATSMGLAACPIGGFLDNELDIMIGNASHVPEKTSDDEKVIYAIAVGYPSTFAKTRK